MLATDPSLWRFYRVAVTFAVVTPTAMGVRTEEYPFGMLDKHDYISGNVGCDGGIHGGDDLHRGGGERKPETAVALGQMSLVGGAAKDDLGRSQDIEDDSAELSDESEDDDGSNAEENEYSSLEAATDKEHRQAEVQARTLAQPSPKLFASRAPMFGETAARRKLSETTVPQASHASQNALKNFKEPDPRRKTLDERFPRAGVRDLVQSNGSIALPNISLLHAQAPGSTARKSSIQTDATSIALQNLDGSSEAASRMAVATQRVEELTSKAEKAKDEVDEAVKFAQKTAEAAERSAVAGAAETQTMAPIVSTPVDPAELSARISKNLIAKTRAQGVMDPSLWEAGSQTNRDPSKIAAASALREAALRQEIQDKASELAALRKAFSEEVESSAARAKQAAIDADTAAGQVEMTAERARQAAHAAGAAAEQAAAKAMDAEKVVTAAAREGVDGAHRDRDKKPALDAEESEEVKEVNETTSDDQGDDKVSASELRYEDDRLPSHSSWQREAQKKSEDHKGTSHHEEDDVDDSVSSVRRRSQRSLTSSPLASKKSKDSKSSSRRRELRARK
eukprot:TRINITY_DN20068_c0_g1_i1.p1 TRINITY_DN20068_c0_g1~~TRINITY_DN20068_c0_g1_i1.p1  ORF type:complete len:567 (-),score=133.21 TRINITY_DN20068_c0_g1_i1:34-1734(-)